MVLVLVEGKRLNWSQSVKYLGLNFDPILTFGSHVDLTCLKASKYIRILYPLMNRRSPLSIANKKLLYKAVFRSIMTYGAPVWSDCAKTHMRKLQVIQNKCLKLAFNQPFFFSTAELHKLAGVELISDFCGRISSRFFHGCQFSENPNIVNLT